MLAVARLSFLYYMLFSFWHQYSSIWSSQNVFDILLNCQSHLFARMYCT
jgi:hypothetical protein